MIYSSLSHPLPEPSPRYKLIAEALREMGQDVSDRDFGLIDSLPTDENAGPEGVQGTRDPDTRKAGEEVEGVEGEG